MIVSFKSKALRELFEDGDSAGINPKWKDRLLVRLERLEVATEIAEVDVMGWQLHELKGKRAGEWALKVTGNYRLTFRWQEGVAFDLDLEDYH